MARIDNLNHFLTDVASAIKTKTGATSVTPANFDTAINNIPTGLEIQGLLKDYYVAAGKNITPGTFIEFVQGVSSVKSGATPYNTIMPELKGTATASYLNGALHRTAQLSDNTVLMVTNTGKYECEQQVIAVGLIFQNSAVSLTNAVYLAAAENNKIAVMRRSNTMGVVWISGTPIHLQMTGQTLSAVGFDEKYGYTIFLQRLNDDQNGIVVDKDGEHVYIVGRGNEDSTTYTNYVGIITGVYSTYQNIPILDRLEYDRDKAFSNAVAGESFTITNLVQATASSFVILGHKFGGSTFAQIVTMDRSTYEPTMGTLYTISTDDNFTYSSAQNTYCCFNQSTGKGLYIRPYTTGYDSTDTYSMDTLKGFLFTVSGSTLSYSAYTYNSTVAYDGYDELNGTILEDGKCLVYWTDEYNAIKEGMICSVSSSISKGTITQLVATDAQDRYESSCKLQTGKSFLFSQPKLDATTANVLQGKEFFYSGLVISDTGTIATMEKQVQPATTLKVDGIAQTGGVGGTATGHNEKILIYVPNV